MVAKFLVQQSAAPIWAGNANDKRTGQTGKTGLQRRVHFLVGVCGILGAPKCYFIENSAKNRSTANAPKGIGRNADVHAVAEFETVGRFSRHHVLEQLNVV